MNFMNHSLWGAAVALTCLAGGQVVARGDDDTDKLEQRLENLREELRVADRGRMKAYSVADNDADRAKALAIVPWDGFLKRFSQLADDAAGTDVAAGAWSTVFLNEVTTAPYDAGWDAFNILVNDYPDSDELAPVVALIPRVADTYDGTLDGLQLLLELSSNHSVQAATLFGLGSILQDDEATREEAFGYFRRVVADYSEVDAGRNATYGMKASAIMFEVEYLQVGMPVPDYTCIDETEASFNLSDYKGKVVLLDFWGFW